MYARESAELREQFEAERELRIATLEATQLQFDRDIQTSREEADRLTRELEALRKEHEVLLLRSRFSCDGKEESVGRKSGDCRDWSATCKSPRDPVEGPDIDGIQRLHSDIALSLLDQHESALPPEPPAISGTDSLNIRDQITGQSPDACQPITCPDLSAGHAPPAPSSVPPDRPRSSSPARRQVPLTINPWAAQPRDVVSESPSAELPSDATRRDSAPARAPSGLFPTKRPGAPRTSGTSLGCRLPDP